MARASPLCGRVFANGPTTFGKSPANAPFMQYMMHSHRHDNGSVQRRQAFDLISHSLVPSIEHRDVKISLKGVLS